MSQHFFSSTGLYRGMRGLNAWVAALIRAGKGPRKNVLLLTTTGRKSGLPRVTPLQFEEIDGKYYLGSARGSQSDWYRNILANPEVALEVGGHRLRGWAEAITQPDQLADFFAMRLKRHPLMIGLLMRLEGLPLRYLRADLVRFAASKTMVVVHPFTSS